MAKTAKHINEAEAALHSYRVAACEWNKLVLARKPVPDTLTREVAAQAAIFISAYNLPSNWTDDSTPVVHLPPDLAATIARNLQQIIGGHIPEWILSLQKKGAPTNKPKAAQWIGIALAYVDACTKDFIEDPAPIKNITEQFGVTRQAYYEWKKIYPSDMNNFFPQATSEQGRAESIKAEVKKAAKLYKAWGRGPTNERPHGKAKRRTRVK